MNDAQSEMPRYKCHKEVYALQIAAIRQGTEVPSPLPDGWAGSWLLVPRKEGFAPIEVMHQWYLKHRPDLHPDGYYVVYPGDGYASFSPAKTFEDGYALIVKEQ